MQHKALDQARAAAINAARQARAGYRAANVRPTDSLAPGQPQATLCPLYTTDAVHVSPL